MKQKQLFAEQPYKLELIAELRSKMKRSSARIVKIRLRTCVVDLTSRKRTKSRLMALS